MCPPPGSVEAAPGGGAAAAGPRAVVIFGDSWAEDNGRVESGLFAGVQGWPIHLAGILGLPVAGNFARGQSESSSLPKQLKAAEAHLGPEAPWVDFLTVLHSGGNDFIGAEKDYNPFARDNFWLAHCVWGFRKKAREVVGNLRECLEQLHARGCRRFLVSDMPFTSTVPALTLALVARVNKRGRWMSEQMEQMLADFCASCGGGVCAVLASEAAALNRIAALSGAGCGGSAPLSLFLRDRFHPTGETHRRLGEVHAAALQGHEILGKGTELAQDDLQERTPAIKVSL